MNENIDTKRFNDDGWRVMSPEEFNKSCPEFYQNVLFDIRKFSNENKFLFLFLLNPGDTDTKEYCIAFFTLANEYAITYKQSDSNSNTYLGATVCKRSTQRLHTHEVRWIDLHSGKFSVETWNRILADIVSYELVDQNTIPPKE